MALILSPSPYAVDKNIQRRANKEMIKNLISRGEGLSQIEKVFTDDGKRITAQLRESILWEIQLPQVKMLLSRGLEVAEIEERMSKTGWVWTPNHRSKAWWEYHKDTIIDKYNTLHSVDAVQKYMCEKKSFPLQPRIYYEWLREWGVSTSPRKPGECHTAQSPTTSAGSATRGSVNEPYQQKYNDQDATSEVSNSPLSDTFISGDGTSGPVQFGSGVSLVPPGYENSFNADLVNQLSLNPFQSNNGNWSTMTPGLHWHDPAMAQPLGESFTSDRHDSAIAIEPGLDQCYSLDTPHLLHPIDGFTYSSSQNSESYDWAPQNFVLRSIPCDKNHQGIGLDYHCCGSSPLQDPAFSTKGYTSEEIHTLPRNYALEGARQYDAAGNTFLHNLATLGAPWDYFKAAIDAQIDPCHQNAHGQTFAHVLNISALRGNLMECLSLIIKHGIDLSQQDAYGWTILHCLFSQAIPPREAEEILRLAEVPRGHLDRRDVSGQTPCELYKQSLRQQAPASLRWDSIELQLQSLAIFKDIGLMRLSDEDVNWQGETNNSPEIRAKLQNQYREVIKKAIDGIVVEAIDGSNAFHAQAGLITAGKVSIDVGCIEKFISLGVGANDYDDRGRTPLEAIITESREYEHELTKSEKVRRLIKKGHANVNSRNRLGHTPLYSAAIRGLDRTVEVLLECRAHPNVRANNNVSLLKAVQDAFERAFAEYERSHFGGNYYEAQCSRIEACKDLLERYGAVVDPDPSKFMGYAYDPYAIPML